MSSALAFAPLMPWGALWALAGVLSAATALAAWRGLGGWPLRAVAGLVLLMVLAQPMRVAETRQALGDIVIALIDDSASQGLGARRAQTEAALTRLRAEVASLGNTDLRVVHAGAAPGGQGGTELMAPLAVALAGEPAGRIAGVVMITDGGVVDAAVVPPVSAPLHVLLTGEAAEWDRRLRVISAPAYGILGEAGTVTLIVEDQGAVPATAGQVVTLEIAQGAEAPMRFDVPVGAEIEVPLPLVLAGENVLRLSVPEVPGEITALNNSANLTVQGVRDRLKVLLVSGEPHPGERVWRNLLKSDPSVDLVHFTILRPPEKQDGIPIEELSLIAFPTRELFIDKIDGFDLIIFDRFRPRGLLPMEYFDNIARYVREGGTVLVAAGPEFGMADGLWRTPLADVLPVEPTARVITEGFRPALTALGRRHPVTAGLEALAPAGGWGRWFRLVEVEPRSPTAQVVMSGPDDLPLLVLDRVGKGRVAVLASDQAWLWARGFEGGGPQQELLRRLAHWMLKEPELEEEALTAAGEGGQLVVTRRSMADHPPGPLMVTAPDGSVTRGDMTAAGPGLYVLRLKADMPGLYRLEQDGLTRVMALGPAAPAEFAAPLASDLALAPVAKATGGGVLWLRDGLPDLRAVTEGRVAYGPGWIGITPRGASNLVALTQAPLIPPALALILALAALVGAWWREGRFRIRAADRAS